MTHTVSFPLMPGLQDMTLSLNPTALSLGSLDIAWYGVIIALGFLLAATYVMRRARQFGSTSDEILDLLLWGLPAAIVGARLYYVLNRWDYYRDDPLSMFAIWEGGLAIYGGLIAAFLVVFIFGKVRKCDMLSILDLCCLGFLIGQCIGRWGNFVNAEAFGALTNLPWGMSIDGGAPVHPTFLYESLWNLLGFMGLHIYSYRRRFCGELTLLYVAWYGLGRGWIEGLRTDSLYLGSTDIRISQLLALLSFVVAVGLLLFMRLSGRGRSPRAATPSDASPDIAGADAQTAPEPVQTTDNSQQEDDTDANDHH